MERGELLIRGAEEPHEMALPTTVSGTNTDGQLSDIAFSTPTVSLVQDVPDFNTQAFIDAVFSMVEPGSGTINENGDVTVQVKVVVDLHIVVPILVNPSDCRAAPVELNLVSTAPYDGERVTLEAANFSIPEVPDGSGCSNLVAPAVNDALAGPGHALSMSFAGEITPPVAGEPTATTLSVSPADGSRLGQEVTLAASVAPDPAVAGAPALSGTVTFYDGASTLGTVALDDDGEALLVTESLGAGSHTLRAAYAGAPPDWQPSSATVSYTVAASPLVSTDLGGEVLIGGPGKDFNVTVTNTSMGAELANAHLDVVIEWTSGDLLRPLPVELSLVEPETITPVPLTLTAGRLRGQIGAPGDWRIAPGDERTEALRLVAPAGTSHGSLRATFTLVTVESGEDVTLSRVVADVILHNGDRIATTLTAGNPGFPPFFPPIPPLTPVVRQGNVIGVNNLGVVPVVGLVQPAGTITMSVDGLPVLGRPMTALSSNPWAAKVPYVGDVSYTAMLPANVPTGVRQLTVTYSGDSLYGPSQASWPVTIEPRIGTIYDCLMQGATPGRFTANVEVVGQVPALGVAGEDAQVDRVQVRLRASRTALHPGSLNGAVGPNVPQTLEVGLEPGGLVTMTELSQSGNTEMGDDHSPIDWTVDLGGGSGAIPVDHAPGESVDVEVGTITVTASVGGFLTGFVCTPMEEAHSMGSMTSVGTNLTVEPGGRVRSGDVVTLSAEALPARPGVIEFRDGTTTVAVAPADADGRAVATVDDLPAGTRHLTARFFGTTMPVTTSDPVELIVEPIQCDDFAESGSAAVVRLVYLTVLNRCPDEAGFEFWVDRLDGGVTREAVARSIAASHEARKVLVDDAYDLMLERKADAEGKEFWATRLGQTGSYRDLIGQLGSSPEFRTLAGGTDTGVVDRLYDRLLHRSPSAEDTAFWVGQIQARGTRATVIKMFDLDEPLRTLVGDTYRTIVDRAPTAVERDAGVALMRSLSDRAALNAQAINTNDFYSLAQTFPNVT